MGGIRVKGRLHEEEKGGDGEEEKTGGTIVDELIK
jgi:hypothetical protein